jgi:hypothetical protein
MRPYEACILRLLFNCDSSPATGPFVSHLVIIALQNYLETPVFTLPLGNDLNPLLNLTLLQIQTLQRIAFRVRPAYIIATCLCLRVHGELGTCTPSITRSPL